jgi:6-phosphogluconate dehydrogenase
MKVGFIGLGRMGLLMLANLVKHKHTVVAFNRSPRPRRLAAKKGAIVASSYADVAAKLPKPRIIWIMVAAGKPVDAVINQLMPALSKGDIIIDGGNSYYKDSIRRYKKLGKKGIRFLDIGTSGGLEGAEKGACFMAGGDKSAYNKVMPLLKAMATKGGYGYFGSTGAGHFVKMVHNGIEYGMLQAYGEGFEMLEKAPYKLDLRKAAEVWNNGSVIRSWLIGLAEGAFRKDARLKKIRGIVGGGETGRWTVKTAKELKVPVPVIKAALMMRAQSKKKEVFSGKVVAALRYEFGRHEVVKK